jgi:hypothetical protein
MRQSELQEFFPRRFALPFRNAAAFAIRIREATMLSNSETTAAQIRLMPAREASYRLFPAQIDIALKPEK